jgi:ubiquinone/menaquinone biosynthesis C-methylase UbiE
MKALLAHVHQKYAYQPRLQVLTDCFAANLESGDRVLDVGCGSGILGAALARHLPGLVVEGVETSPRGGEPIRVHAYRGGALPFSDDSYDVVILADVLHHDRDPLNVLKECARVASRRVIVKDHLKHGGVSYLRISALDWAANQPYGVDCLYTYWTREE